MCSVTTLLLRSVHTRELVPAARSCNTLPEQSSLVCTNHFQRKNMLCNFQNGGRGTTSSHAPIGLFHHSAASSCPLCVMVGVLTRERVSGACFRSKLPRVYRPLLKANTTLLHQFGLSVYSFKRCLKFKLPHYFAFCCYFLFFTTEEVVNDHAHK